MIALSTLYATAHTMVSNHIGAFAAGSFGLSGLGVAASLWMHFDISARARRERERMERLPFGLDVVELMKPRVVS